MDTLQIAGRKTPIRLIVAQASTSLSRKPRALEASGAEMVTVAVRR